MNTDVNLSPPDHLTKYLWRHVQKSDIPAIQDMMTSAISADAGETVASEEQIVAIFNILGEEGVVTNTRIAIADDGAIVALALVYFRPDEEQHVALLDSLVHVDHRAHGIGGYILDWMEARVRQEFAQINDAVPQLMRMSCAEHQTERITLFKRRGFEPVRYAYRMQQRLDQNIPLIPLPHGLRFVAWQEALDAPLMHAFNDAFHDHWGLPRMNAALWRQFFTGVSQFRGDLTYLAMHEEAIVGFCLNWVDESQQLQRGVREGWIEAIGVIPSWRGRGVASALMTKTLNAFIAQGLAQVALNVDTQNPTGALGLYEKLGFHAAQRTITFGKNLPWEREIY